MNEKVLSFEPFLERDVEETTAIMKRSFDEDSRIHLGRDSGGPPGYDDGSFLRRFALHKDATAFRICRGGCCIGAVILWIDEKSQENVLGALFLDVDVQEKGIGIKVWNRIEQLYPDTKVWKTETPLFSHRNHHFYVNKCGFHIISIENPKDWSFGSFHMEKRMKYGGK